MSGECSPVAESDCHDCHFHHSEDAVDPKENPEDDSEHPHDHHHGCQATVTFILPEIFTGGLYSPSLLGESFRVRKTVVLTGYPFELDRPPRG